MNRALILIDTQREYSTEGGIPIVHPPLQVSVRCIVDAVRAAAEAGVPVVVVRQISPPGAWACAEGSPGAELLPEVAEGRIDLVVDKRSPSAFPGTGLDAWLRAHGVGRVTVAGFMTQNCVQSTVREADQLGYRVDVLHDATGTVGLENGAGRLTARQVHESALVVMASRFASVGSTADWCDRLRSGVPWPPPNLSLSVRPGVGRG